MKTNESVEFFKNQPIAFKLLSSFSSRFDEIFEMFCVEASNFQLNNGFVDYISNLSLIDNSGKIFCYTNCNISGKHIYIETYDRKKIPVVLKTFEQLHNLNCFLNNETKIIECVIPDSVESLKTRMVNELNEIHYNYQSRDNYELNTYKKKSEKLMNISKDNLDILKVALSNIHNEFLIKLNNRLFKQMATLESKSI